MNQEISMSHIMNYNWKQIKKIIIDCCSKLNVKQPLLFLQKNDVNERTISTELSKKLDEEIQGYHINCEYNRMVDENGVLIPKKINLNPQHPIPSRVFPDIIIHRQEDGLHNLLVIEIKMEWKNEDRERDFRKLEAYKHDLNYQHSVYLELGEKGITNMIQF
jgi:hypothetical protein